MKALFFDKELSVRDIPRPAPLPGEVLIRIRQSAVCNTDLELIKGYMGFRGVPGHEFVGEVVTEGSSLHGKRVVGEINNSCGTCYLCKTDRPSHCATRTVTGIAGHQGIFAEYVCLPEKNLHPVPDQIPDDIAIFTEPLAAALAITDQIHIPPSGPVLVFGTGKLGLLISMVLKLNGADVLSLDVSPERVAFASDLGIKASLLKDFPADRKAEFCIDCTGHAKGLTIAMDHLYPRGTLILKTTVATPDLLDLNQIVINEFRIQGSRCGPFAPALRLLSSGLVDPRPLITARVPFHEVIRALEVAGNPENMKVIIDHT